MIKLPSLEARKREAHTQVRLMVALEQSAKNALAQEFQRVASVAARNWRERQHVDMGKLMHEHQAKLSTLLRRIYAGAAHSFARRVLDRPKSHAKARTREESGASAEASIEVWIREWTAKKVVDISKSTEKLIMAAVNAHQEQELTGGEVADVIAEKLGGPHALARAETIARTETHAAAMYGSMAAANELGIPDLKKIWIATHDEAVRDAHLEADGQEVPMDQPFLVDDEELDFPGDPSGSPGNVINCRCAMVYG